MKKFTLFLLILFFMGNMVANAQTRVITGTVTSSDDGSPIPEVTVFVKGTTIGTTTDVGGNYRLSIPANAKTIVFSFVGMKTLEIPVEGKSVIDAKLNPDVLSVDEIVVTAGYGSGKKLGSIVGSVSTVSEEKIMNKPSANVLDALQGQVAGVMIYTSSGEPSETSSVIIRGSGSLEGSTTPLYILDGVAVSSATILAINPNDFENVTILKDASATSIYGSRAANGVVVYTTKKGKRNTKGTISFDGLYGLSSLSDSKLWNSLFDTEGLLNFWEESGIQSPSTIEGIKGTYGEDSFNWKDYYYKPGKKLYEANLSYRGGSDKTDYFVSFGAHNQEGLAYRSKFNRYSTRMNLNTQVNDWFKSGINVNLAYTEQNTNPYASNYLTGGLSYLAPPFYTPYDENGDEYYETKIPGWNQYGLKYRTDMYPYYNSKVSVTANTYQEITPIKGLKLKTLNSIDAYDQNITSQQSAEYASAPGNGSLSEYRYRKYQYQTTNTAEYSLNIDNIHQFVALVGQEYIYYNYKSLYAAVAGIEDDRLAELDMGTGTKSMSSGTSEHAYFSLFGTLNYSYNSKYFFDASVRRDETSLLAQNNRDGWFFSVGGRWKILREDFMSSVNWLSKLDLRISYGTQGRSDIDEYEYYSLVGTTTYGDNTGWQISTFGNTNLGWEKQKQFSVGIETSAFNDRLNLILEAYDKRNEDLHVAVPYPYTSGVTEVMKNAASLQNLGIEVAISYDVLKGKDYYVQPYVNFAYNKEKITELFPEAEDNGRYWPMDDYCLMWTVGQARTFYVPLWAGVNSETGAPQWYVPSDDPSETTKNEDDLTETYGGYQNTGKILNPDMTGGFGLRAGYKGFSFEADFTYQLHKYLVNNDGYYAMNPTAFTAYNASSVVTDYWKEPGDETRFPSTDYYFTQFDDRLVEDASFLRLKIISLSYTLPESLLAKSNFFGSARVFVTGRNLLTFTKYSGQDPENDTNLTYGANPNTQQISFGFNVTF